MRKLSFLVTLLAVLPLTAFPQLTQTFEVGEDTSNWGDAWTGGSITGGFLSPAFGGQLAGTGTGSLNGLSASFYRSFKNNTGGVNLSSPYYLSLYIQLSSAANSGEFQVMDGEFGGANAGSVRAVFTGTPGVLQWQANDQNTGWQTLDVAMLLATPYQVIIAVDPATRTYSATVNQTDADGVILDTDTRTGLAFDQNVINNHQNGKLQFFLQASPGTTTVVVDNIRIQDGAVPEPTTATLLACGLATLLFRRNRRAA